MIFKKKQDAAVQQTAAGEAKPAAKGGKAAAFFRKNWKWMVPVVCVAVLGGWFILRPDKAQNGQYGTSTMCRSRRPNGMCPTPSAEPAL